MTISLQRIDQINKPDTFDDTLNAASIAGVETSAVDFADYHEGLISQVKRILHGDEAGNWHDDVTTVGASLKDLSDREALEDKLALSYRLNVNDISVPASQNWIALSGAYKPSKVIAIGAAAEGAVTAQLAGAIGSHALDEIAGSNPLRPKNIVRILNGATGDAVTSSDREVFALLQVGSSATDGNAFGDSGNDQGQLSFVRANATFDDLEAVPVADIEGRTCVLAYSVRENIADMPEEFFRSDMVAADPQAGVTVTLDAAYDGGHFVTIDAGDLDLRIADSNGVKYTKGAGGSILFEVQRDDGGTDLVKVGSAVDTFDVDAADSDFAQGVSIDTADQTVNVGKTAQGVIDSTSIETRATTGDNVVSAASGDVKFTSVRETALPLDDATAGAISALGDGGHASVSAAIAAAMQSGGVDMNVKVHVAASNYAQGVNIPAATLDLTAFTVDMNTPANTDAFVFLNGRLLHGGNAGTKNDAYVGDTAANGDLKVDFPKGIKAGDVLITVGFQQ